jgi:uncharacterized protein (TIGR02145 family)
MDDNMKKAIIVLYLLTFSFCESLAQKEDLKNVLIGNQLWMSINLDVSTFRNGDTIREVKSKEEWIIARENMQPAWCYYEFDPKNSQKYGKLYNWYAVLDSRQLAPLGYRIPRHNEWSVLFNKRWKKSIKTFDGNKTRIIHPFYKPSESLVVHENNVITEDNDHVPLLPIGYIFHDDKFDHGNYYNFWIVGRFGAILKAKQENNIAIGLSTTRTGSISISGSLTNIEKTNSESKQEKVPNIDSVNFDPKKLGLSVRCIKND